MLPTGRMVLALVLATGPACTHQFDPVDADPADDLGDASQTTPECVDAVAHGGTYRACVSLENHADAAAACVAWGGTLVMLDSEQEEQEVTAFAYEHGTANYWLGATDLEEEGVWRWVDGQVFWSLGQVPLGQFSHWIEGEPGNTSSMSMSDEDCAYMYRKVGWNDVDCTFERPYVCERR